MEKFGCLPRELLNRSTVDDIREIMAYYRIQAQDRAQEQWSAKIAELHEKREKANGARATQGSMTRR